LQVTLWFIKISLPGSQHSRNAGDFSDAAGEQEMVLKCGSLREMRETWQFWCLQFQ